MNKSLRSFFISVSIGLSWLLVSTIASADVPTIQHWQAKDGADVFFVKTTGLPMVDINVVFAAGSAYDKNHYGLAQLVNSALNQGAGKLSADKIAASFASVGAKYYHDVNRDFAEISLRSLTKPQYLKTALRVFTTIMSDPTFDHAALARVRQQSIGVVKLGMQDPATIASRAFYQLVYGDAPYAHSPVGSLASIPELDNDQVKNFYQQYYVVNNLKVIIVGNVSQQQANHIAEQVTGNLPEGRAAPALKPASRLPAQQQIAIDYPSKQTTIMLGQVGITYQNPNFFPLLVGNRLLGRLPLTSLLFQQVREKRGLAYYAYSYFKLLRYRGPFIISLQTANAHAKAALKVVKQTVHHFLTKGMTSAQLARSKDNLLGGFALGLASNRDIVAAVTRIAFYQLPLDYLNKFKQHVSAVSAKQVRKAFNKLITEKRMVQVTVGAPQKTKKHGKPALS